MELLKEKIVSLHNFNEEFSLENAKLKFHIETITQDFDENKNSDEVKTEFFCENCQLIQSELHENNNLLEKYKFDNNQLQQDTHMLKILIYRLNVQLERCQDRVRCAISNKSEYQPKPDLQQNEPLKWGSVNNDTLGPLLNALTQSISEKSELIQKCEETLNNLTFKMKEILLENEHLYSKIEDITLLHNQVYIWKSRSEILLKKNEYLTDKLGEVIECYDDKVLALATDYREVCLEYGNMKQELDQKEMQMNMPEELHKMCNENLQAANRSLEDLKTGHSQELAAIKDAYESELTKLKQECSELENKYEISKQLSEKSLKKIKTLRITLEEALSWKRVYQTSQEAVKNSQQIIWKDMNKMEKLINMKEVELRKSKKKYSTDMKQMSWELKHRERRLQDVQDKFKRHLEQCGCQS